MSGNPLVLTLSAGQAITITASEPEQPTQILHADWMCKCGDPLQLNTLHYENADCEPGEPYHSLVDWIMEAQPFKMRDDTSADSARLIEQIIRMAAFLQRKPKR